MLIVSVSFLAYRHPPAQLEPITRWLRPGKRRQQHRGGNGAPIRPLPTPSEREDDVHSAVQIDVTEPTETESTTEVTVVEPELAVPALSLNGSMPERSKQPRATKPWVPLFPAADSAQRASSVPRSPKGTATAIPNGTSGLMPPPARPSSVPPPSSAASLRVPSNGPLPNRGPPINSQQRVSGGLSVNGAVTPPRARGKVLLAPGHSPMDWAALTRSSNLSGVSTFQRVTPSVLKSMTGRKGKPAWTSWQGKVYNITPYLPFHPGGQSELMRAAGRDATKLFMEVHPWVNWENMLGSCMVGVLVSENDGMAVGGSSLEAID